MTAAAQLAVHSRHSPRIKCYCQIGRTTDISNNSSHAINRECKRRMDPCCLWVAVTTSCLLNPRAERSLNVFVVQGLGSSGISIRASGTIQLYTGRCETNSSGLQPGSPENQHQAIVPRGD